MNPSPLDNRMDAPRGSEFAARASSSNVNDHPPQSATADLPQQTVEELQQTVSDLRNSEELFRLLVARVQDYAIFMLDLEGNVATWNAGATRIKGYQASEIIGRHFSCFYTSEDIAAGKPQSELAVAARVGRYAEEGTRLRKDGSTFWASVVITALFDDQRRLRGYAKVTQDVTTSKQAEDKSRLMVSLALNAMVLVDERGMIAHVNPQTETLFGYTREQLVGQPIEILVPDRFRAEHPTNRSRYIRNPVVRPMGAGRDLYGRRSDGSEFPVEIGLHPIETESGRQVLGSIVDITERKHAEEQARKYLAELAHVSRLSTMGQMVSELAHEMNQPLAAAANYARACVNFARAKQGATLDELVDLMAKSSAQIERTLEIVNRLAAFVKNEPAKRSLININRVIENIVALSSVGAAGGSSAIQKITPILELDESLPLVSADRIQIEQVLLNLVRNGIEGIQELPAVNPRLLIRTSADREFLRVDVSDNGKGISTEHKSELFSPFFSTKPNGMGMGLSISRSIIENHRGKLTVESTPGESTTFSFTLPIPTKRDS